MDITISPWPCVGAPVETKRPSRHRFPCGGGPQRSRQSAPTGGHPFEASVQKLR